MNDPSDRSLRERGFTLIELMVVVLILGILMAIAIPTFLSLTSSAKTNAAESDLTTATQDEANYETQYGDFDGTPSATPYATDNVLAAAVPPGVAGIDSGLNWITTGVLTGTAGTKTVNITMISANQLVLGTAGALGKFYWVNDNNSTLTYDYNSTATVPTTITGWGSSWKTATNN